MDQSMDQKTSPVAAFRAMTTTCFQKHHENSHFKYTKDPMGDGTTYETRLMSMQPDWCPVSFFSNKGKK